MLVYFAADRYSLVYSLGDRSLYTELLTDTPVYSVAYRSRFTLSLTNIPVYSIFLLFFSLFGSKYCTIFYAMLQFSDMTPTALYPELEALFSAMPTLDKNALIFLKVST